MENSDPTGGLPDFDPSAFSFEAIDETIPVAGGAAREPAGGTLHKTGRLPLNAEGSDQWRNVVYAKGWQVANAGARFQADTANKVVAAYPIVAGKGAMPVREGAGGEIILHLGGVFKAKPLLRPGTKQEVRVVAGPDGQGNPCLLIFLQTALAKSATPSPPGQAKVKRTRRKKTDAQNQNQNQNQTQNQNQNQNQNQTQQAGATSGTAPSPEQAGAAEEAAAGKQSDPVADTDK
jgi:hypothetical protein